MTEKRRPGLQWRLLGTIGLGTLLNPLNSSMIAVALIDIRLTFDVGFASASWLIASYYLASAVGQPLLGRLGDLIGRRRVFLVGLAVVAVASSAAPFAPSFAALVAIRILQALGTSALFPSGLGIVRSTHGPGQARALGVLSVFASTSAAIGPTIGGYLVAWGGWQAIFIVNLPIIVLCGSLALLTLPRDAVAAPVRVTMRRLDLPGAALFVLTALSALWWLMSLTGQVAWPALVAAVLAAAGLIVVERRVRRQASPDKAASSGAALTEPFLDFAALGGRGGLLPIYAMNAAVNIVFYAIFFGVPSYLQSTAGQSPAAAGLTMLPLASLSVLITPVSARLIDRYGAGVVLRSGTLLLAGGCAGMLVLQETWPIAALGALLGLLGMANGAVSLALQTAMYDTAAGPTIGSAAGLFQTSRYVGTMLASTLLALTFGQELDLTALHTLAAVLTAVMVLVLVGLVVAARPRRRDHP